MQMAIVIAMYRANSKFIECKLHLEVEEVFGSMNQRSNSPPGLKGIHRCMTLLTFFVHEWTKVQLKIKIV
jgi:hypothetical protein